MNLDLLDVLILLVIVQGFTMDRVTEERWAAAMAAIMACMMVLGILAFTPFLELSSRRFGVSDHC